MCPRLPQVSAIRTALVDEAFGDYNEKTMADIATWEETFDWLEIFVERISKPPHSSDAPKRPSKSTHYSPRTPPSYLPYNH